MQAGQLLLLLVVAVRRRRRFISCCCCVMSHWSLVVCGFFALDTTNQQPSRAFLFVFFLKAPKRDLLSAFITGLGSIPVHFVDGEDNVV